MKEINLDAILKSYLTVEAMRLNNPNYTYNMVIAAMKHACCEVLDLAAENVIVDYYEDSDTGEIENIHAEKSSILQIKDWIK